MYASNNCLQDVAPEIENVTLGKRKSKLEKTKKERKKLIYAVTKQTLCNAVMYGPSYPN